jgi:hypothetical protein
MPTSRPLRSAQARGVMAADASGTSDPYAVIYFEGQRVRAAHRPSPLAVLSLTSGRRAGRADAGVQVKTTIHEQTLDPVWKQTFKFKASLPPLPRRGSRIASCLC